MKYKYNKISTTSLNEGLDWIIHSLNQKNVFFLFSFEMVYGLLESSLLSPQEALDFFKVNSDNFTYSKSYTIFKCIRI